MPKTILLIDDETMVVDIAKKQLMQKGYNVLTAYDGEQALAALKKVWPDLIVLDIQMPKMNGYTFLTELRKLEGKQEPKVPVLVLTAYDSMEPIFKRHGVAGYLLKPLKLDALLDKVHEILSPASS